MFNRKHHLTLMQLKNSRTIYHSLKWRENFLASILQFIKYNTWIHLMMYQTCPLSFFRLYKTFCVSHYFDSDSELYLFLIHIFNLYNIKSKFDSIYAEACQMDEAFPKLSKKKQSLWISSCGNTPTFESFLQTFHNTVAKNLVLFYRIFQVFSWKKLMTEGKEAIVTFWNWT